MGNKYPWIPREYYAATMFACKMIRENGYFNRAIAISSRYYSVDRDELERHVKARQNAGKKGMERKYYWFGVEYFVGGERCPYFIKKMADRAVVKATSRENAMKQLWKKYDRYVDGAYGDTDTYFGEVVRFQNKKEAEVWSKEEGWREK